MFICIIYVKSLIIFYLTNFVSSFKHFFSKFYLRNRVHNFGKLTQQKILRCFFTLINIHQCCQCVVLKHHYSYIVSRTLKKTFSNTVIITWRKYQHNVLKTYFCQPATDLLLSFSFSHNSWQEMSDSTNSLHMTTSSLIHALSHFTISREYWFPHLLF